MKAYRIGIDVGGTKIAYGLFDEDNNLIDRLREATDPSIDGPSLADQILRQIRTVLQRNALEEKDLKGIGVCMPSFILFDEGYICMTSAMTNVRDFPMRSYMAERLSVPIVHRQRPDSERGDVSRQLRLGGGERAYAHHPG